MTRKRHGFVRWWFGAQRASSSSSSSVSAGTGAGPNDLCVRRERISSSKASRPRRLVTKPSAEGRHAPLLLRRLRTEPAPGDVARSVAAAVLVARGVEEPFPRGLALDRGDEQKESGEPDPVDQMVDDRADSDYQAEKDQERFRRRAKRHVRSIFAATAVQVALRLRRARVVGRDEAVALDAKAGLAQERASDLHRARQVRRHPEAEDGQWELDQARLDHGLNELARRAGRDDVQPPITEP